MCIIISVTIQTPILTHYLIAVKFKKKIIYRLENFRANVLKERKLNFRGRFKCIFRLIRGGTLLKEAGFSFFV